MKLLISSWFYPPIVGGTENIARAGADGLAERGHEVTVLTSANADGEAREERPRSGVRIHRWPELHPLRDDAAAAEALQAPLRRLLRSTTPDLVHAHLLTYPLAPRRSTVLLDLFAAQHLPVVDQIHGGTYERDPEACVRLMPRPDFFISDSHHVQERVERFFSPSHPWVPPGGVTLPPIRVLHPSITTPDFTPDAERRRAERAHLGFSDDDLVVFFPSRFFDIDGSLSVAKRPLVALQAFAGMCRRGAERAVLLAVLPPGFSGRSNEEDSRRRVRELIASHDIAERCRFLNRAVPHHEMATLFRCADLTLVPSLEGFGLVYLESMACGVPVVGVAEGAAVEVVGDRGGVLVPPSTSADTLARRLGECLASLYQDSARRADLARGALRLVRREHDRERWTGELEDLLRRVRAGHGASAD